MLDHIADYRVLDALEDPAAPGARWLVEAPDRLATGTEPVVVEVVPADPADVLPDLARWAAAGGPGLAVPLEVGPWDGTPDGPGPGAWVSRRLPLRGRPEPLAGGGATVAALAGVARALAALHAVGAIHGGLRPARLLAGGGGASLDLPGAAAAGPSGRLLVARSAADLDTVAPELLRGEVPDAAADVWALAATALQVLGGRLAHPALAGAVLLDGVAEVLGGDPDLGGIDDDLAEALAPALRTDPGDRAPAGALADALGALDGGAW